jgi:hypothetical protein
MPTVQLELWHLVTLLLAFFGCVATFGKVLLDQIEKRLTEKFEVLDKKSDEWGRLERELLQLKADMPLHYVRREDYVRNQTVIEAKLDRLATSLENAQLKGVLKS